MLRAVLNSGLGAAQVLAAPAGTMRTAGTRVASSCLGAALLLAAFAAAMRDAGTRGERVWGVRHGGAAWGLVMQHCGIAAGVTRLG
jgi:hypothetical protein